MPEGDIQAWTLVVRIVALVVAAAGLIVIIIQLSRVNSTIVGNAFSSTFAELREIHKVFIDDPKLRPYFFDKELLRRESDYYQKARSVAEMYLDAFIHMYLLRPRFPKELRSHIDLFVDDMLRSSPFLAGYVRENADFMPRDLRVFALRLLTRMS